MMRATARTTITARRIYPDSGGLKPAAHKKGIFSDCFDFRSLMRFNEAVALPILGGNPEYRRWIGESLE